MEVLEDSAYLRGTKVTGDPNVPFDQTSFEVSRPECLDISLENQSSCNQLRKILGSASETKDKTTAIDFQVRIEGQRPPLDLSHELTSVLSDS